MAPALPVRAALGLAISTARAPKPGQAPDCHLPCSHLRELPRRSGRFGETSPQPLYLVIRGGEFCFELSVSSAPGGLIY